VAQNLVTPEDIHRRLQKDLVYFNRVAGMKIKDKGGAIVPFVFNTAQRYIHDKIEEQLKTLGRVRVVLLKGRQQGGSTYIANRFYHKTTRNPGTSTFILSHAGGTTDKLFSMVRRYHDNIGDIFRPVEGASNRNQLAFAELDSEYTVGTAGNKNVGRGSTSQLFHGSEPGYWENDYDIQNGALQSIGDAPGTEIILESTANGPKGLFYDKCRAAMRGESDYILIFVPWFWQEEYEAPVDPDTFQFTDEERDLVERYFAKPFPYQTKPIPVEKAMRKMAWRRKTIVDNSVAGNREAGLAEFRRIYPNNPIEAFRATGVSLFRSDAIEAARAHVVGDPVGPLVCGVDPAGDSDNSDRTVIVLRRGRVIEPVIKYSRMRPMELAGIIAALITKRGVDMVFVDRGYGEGTIDRLHEMGFGGQVQGVAFNERPIQQDIYANKRSEMIIEFATWVNRGGVQIPDNDEFHEDLAAIPVDKRMSGGLRLIPSKDEIKRVLKKSTDIVDAASLTFAYPVMNRDFGGAGNSRWRKAGENDVATRAAKGGLRSRQRKWGRA